MIDYVQSTGCTAADYSACEVWAHADRLGSTIATSNSAGAVGAGDRYTYSPYGEPGEGTGGLFGSLRLLRKRSTLTPLHRAEAGS